MGQLNSGPPIFPFQSPSGTSSRLQFTDLLKEPRPGESPVALGRALGDVEDETGFGIRHTGEEAEFHEFGGFRLFVLKVFEGFVEDEEGFVVSLHGDVGMLKVQRSGPAAALEGIPPAGALDENAADGFRRGGKKVTTVFEPHAFLSLIHI